LESHRAFATPRVLLPSEIQIIEALGLTEDEYWEFLRLNDEYNGKRAEAYAHIPDIKNEPVSLTAIVVNLVVGIALTAVGALLAPKPRSPEQKKAGPQLATEGQTSRSRYAPQSSFDSIQQLAVLGSVIPLVYTNQQTLPSGPTYGGVRVNSSLIWSLMTSLGRNQQLRALMLFSHGPVEGRPDFEGYAIGDLLVADYALGKIALYFKHNHNGGRFSHDDAYPTDMEPPYDTSKGVDPFAFKWANGLVQYFSGARTPSTQAVFGTFACLPNGNRYRVNYELLLKPDSIDGDVEDDIRDKQRKIRDSYPRYGYVYGPGKTDDKYVPAGSEVTYVLASNTFNDQAYGAGGIVDIQQATNNGRIDADSNLIVGETYLIGTGYGVLVNKEGSPWAPGRQVKAVFRMTTDAQIDTRDEERKEKPENLSIQRIAVATISNNRACNRTDLTIKSTVYRKINGFPNVNSQPNQATIDRYEEKDGTITLGQLNIYNKRQSFFALLYRKQGDTTWINITPEGTGFVVEGRTPEAVYNQICIIHPDTSTEAYEYQLAPLAGAAVARYWGFPGQERYMYFLDAAGAYDNAWKQPEQNVFEHNGFSVWYTGYRKLFRRDEGSNKEWELYGVTIGRGYDLYGDVNVGGVNGETVNLRYGDAYQDFVVYDAEELSNQSAPEHEIVSVNEILYTDPAAAYSDLVYAGIRLNSGTEWSSFNELSAYFKQGISVKKLLFASKEAATNLLPEIAYDLLTNTEYGVGELVGESQVDINEMRSATLFCQANSFFWDGVIGERVNIREWIYENAGYCLLQFRIKGGRFSLYPDVPFETSGQIQKTKPISPKVLFTDGNMKDLQVSFLSPEERQLFKATVLWRQETTNGFPQTRTVVVTLTKDEDSRSRSPDNDPEETFDMSGFCTSQEHAETFAKYALKTRQLVDHGIKFQTTPQMAMGLEPGEYFQVASAVTHSDTDLGSRLNNGSIDGEGNIIGLDLDNDTYEVQYWKPGTQALNTDQLQVVKGKTSNSTLWGSIFAVSRWNNPQTRVYKLESLTYAEDGLVEVAGSVAPLTEGGSLATLDWGNNDDHFTVRAA
jgi:hypothetical protein